MVPAHRVLGRQYLMEFHGCNFEHISQVETFQEIAMQAAIASKATVVHPFFHQFQPQGVSGVIVISESHLTFHTWPEHFYVAADLFTCSESIDVSVAFEVLTKGLRSTHSQLSVGIPRGYVSNGNHIVDVPMAPTLEDFAATASMDWEEIYRNKDAWGILASIDIHNCNPDLIRDADHVRKFAVQICDHIGMKRYGETTVVDFGEDERVAGFSMTQLIETSLISGHFANQSNNAHLDIFSCKFFSPEKAALFCLDFFKGQDYSLQVSLRK